MRRAETVIVAVWIAISLSARWTTMASWQHVYFYVVLPGMLLLFGVLELAERRKVRRRVRADARLDP